MIRVTAVLEQEDHDTWLAHIAEDDRCHTFGTTREHALEMLLEAAQLWYDTDDVEVIPPS